VGKKVRIKTKKGEINISTKNIVPRADGEGGLGTAAKAWLTGFIKTLTCATELKTDTISEKTAAAGVTADGVQFKDSQVYTDQINEKTGAAGVNVDNVLNKDGGVSNATAGSNLGLQGSEVIDSDNQLVAADFPNAVTLYGQNMDSASADGVAAAYTGGTFGTAKTFTVRGAELTAAADVLADATHYCVFGGSAYLESTDATIKAATGTFSVPIWVYQADWATTAADGIVSCTSANMQNGWEMKLTTTEDLTVATYNANATATMTLTANTAGLSVGWHHIVWVHTNAASDKIYIDGNLAAGATDTSNTYAAGGLELCLGASNNHTALLTGRLDEFALHSATALTDDQVRQIYARSAKKFAVKDANTNVIIPQNCSSGVYTPTLTNTTNVAASTAYACPWSRIGGVVTVGLKVDIDPTSAAPTNTVLDFTLPIACTATPTGAGSAGSGATIQGGAILPSSATQMKLQFQAESTANVEWEGTFQYVIN